MRADGDDALQSEGKSDTGYTMLVRADSGIGSI